MAVRIVSFFFKILQPLEPLENNIIKQYHKNTKCTGGMLRRSRHALIFFLNTWGHRDKTIFTVAVPFAIEFIT